jgi:hypothetical protein
VLTALALIFTVIILVGLPFLPKVLIERRDRRLTVEAIDEYRGTDAQPRPPGRGGRVHRDTVDRGRRHRTRRLHRLGGGKVVNAVLGVVLLGGALWAFIGTQLKRRE